MTRIYGNSDAGVLIRELRTQAGMTQAELGRKLNMSAATVSALETRPVLKTSTLQRVLGILGYDIVYTAVSRDFTVNPGQRDVSALTGEHG